MVTDTISSVFVSMGKYYLLEHDLTSISLSSSLTKGWWVGVRDGKAAISETCKLDLQLSEIAALGICVRGCKPRFDVVESGIRLRNIESRCHYPFAHH